MREVYLIKCKSNVVTYDNEYNVWEDTPRVKRATLFSNEVSARKKLTMISRDLCVNRSDLKIVKGAV